MEENGLTFKEYPDGRVKIDLDSGTKTVGLRNLTGILGYQSSNGPTYTPHISDRPVDIHNGLRYITVSCNLVNREHNIGPDGNRSTIITSLPINGAKPLFGTVTKYNDIDIQAWVNAGSFTVYVTEIESFVTKLDPIKPTYNKPKGTFIDKLSFDYHSNSYFCSLAAAYIATFKCGISEDHLTNNRPDSHSNISKLLDQYIMKDDMTTIRKFIPVHETWKKKNGLLPCKSQNVVLRQAGGRTKKNKTSKIPSD
ncbi:Hypothetical predicted protein [Paramuricea clavata]|uniref:Uncharacterized protein n=1 Tax=Paramuricea clavata TaxID=317549 RepID=A0A6S7HTG8_PARCT|nr:Hypothetical predicted protein [Paramuricea clavata]